MKNIFIAQPFCLSFFHFSFKRFKTLAFTFWIVMLLKNAIKKSMFWLPIVPLSAILLLLGQINSRFFYLFQIKYRIYYYQKLFQRKCIDLTEVNNFAFLCFFRISYSLTEKWNFDIDFLKVSIYCNFANFCLIKKCYDNNW